MADFLQAGGNIEDLMAEAERKHIVVYTPALVRDKATWALSELARITVAIEAAQDAAERGRLAAELHDMALLDGIGAALYHEESAVNAAVAKLSAFRGVKTAVDKALVTARKRRKGIESALQSDVDVASYEPVLVTLRQIAKTSGLAPQALNPHGWRCDPGGVWAVSVNKDGEEIVRKVGNLPLIVSGTGVETKGEGVLTLRWHALGAWRELEIPRKAALVARDLAPFAGMGLPVNSTNAGELVAYLDAYLARNEPILPRRQVATTLGWKAVTRAGQPGGRVFVLGDRSLGAEGEEPVNVATHTLRDYPLSAGYRAGGTPEGWKAALATVKDRKALVLALVASCAAPLIRIIPSAPNAILDFAGPTSQGKTTALRFAASAWGMPNERDEHGIVGSWNAKPTYLERVAGMVPDLPILLDDTKNQQDKKILAEIVYGVASGIGRGRGSIVGVQPTARWYTVLISTGENPIVSHMREHGGGVARVITLWGSPMGQESTENGDLARALNRAVVAHHGHVGPALVRLLLRPGAPEAAEAAWHGHLAAWSNLAGGDAVNLRRAETFALLSCSLDLLRALGLDLCDPLPWAWAQVSGDADSQGKADVNALIDAWSWAVANQGQLDSLPATRHPPNGGYIGRAGRSKEGEDYAIAFGAAALKKHLSREGYEPDAVVRRWDERGWVTRGEKYNREKVVKVAGACCRCVCVRLAGLIEAGCIGETGAADLWPPLEKPAASEGQEGAPPHRDEDRWSRD